MNRRLLSHNTGLTWDSTGHASITRYTWRADSPFASECRDDSIVRRSIYNLLQDAVGGVTRANAIIQFFIDNPTTSAHVFDPIVSPFPSGRNMTFRYDNPLRLNNALALGGVDYIGTITLKAVRLPTSAPVPNGAPSVVVSEITFNGHIEDLYDFEFNTNTRAAIVQAGAPTLGNAGRIFWTQVDLTGTSVLPLSAPPVLDMCRDPLDDSYNPKCDGLQP